MLYRAAVISIIAFWLVMMGLLVRLEIHPEATDILDVPVPYVLRFMFKHSQQSLLTVNDGTKPIGFVTLRPSITGSNGRALDFSGSMAVPQRFNFNGTVAMDASLRVYDFHVAITIRQPRCQLDLAGDASHNRLTYSVHMGNQPGTSQSLPMDAGLLPTLAQNLGIDPHFLPVSPAAISPPVVNAREAQIWLHGEQLEVYQVSIIEGGSPMIDFYVTQLGQIILAKTSFGFTLSAEDWE